MDYLGLFCLGAFVGTVAALGVRYVDTVEEWQKVLAAMLPAVLSGVVIAMVDRFRDSAALGSYPLGLMCALMWTYSDVAVRNIARQPFDPGNEKTGGYPGQRAIGVLHLTAAVVVTLSSIAAVIVPTWPQLMAELHVPREARVSKLVDHYNQIGKPECKEKQKVATGDP